MPLFPTVRAVSKIPHSSQSAPSSLERAKDGAALMGLSLERRRRISREFWLRLLSYTISLGINLAIVAFLAEVVVREVWLPQEKPLIVIMAPPKLPPPPPVEEPVVLIEMQEELTQKAVAPVGTPLQMAVITTPATLETQAPLPAPVVGSLALHEAPKADKGTHPVAEVTAPESDPYTPAGGGLEGRWEEARTRLLMARGGTPASESAVDRALQWLAAHQREDGSWRFEHQGKECDRTCDHGGTYSSTTGATALALLPFLGHGEWHGENNRILRKGLDYLVDRMVVSPRGGDLQEGSMYAQGLATLALCEAYAMTGEKRWGNAAQKGLAFIESSQHEAGGWRYFPNQPGDTTVLGWQMMALKTGSWAGLKVSEETVEKGYRFLDLVQGNRGATYGYQDAGEEPSPTAIGLLCRMHGGWNQLDLRLQRGIVHIQEQGFSRKDMYFNYYATQVMANYGGPRWEAWNEPLRDYLITSQVTQGHGKGSWYFGGKHTLAGGRLCETALACLILEVYYRHLPLYGGDAIKLSPPRKTTARP